jgi:hypothetical protein
MGLDPHEAVYRTYLTPSSAYRRSYPWYTSLGSSALMSQTPITAAASSRFQTIFQAASKSCQKQAKKDILVHPLTSQLNSCDSTSAIIAVLQDQVREFDKARDGDERLTKWLGPTVNLNVLYAFSAAVSGGVGLVCLRTELMQVAKHPLSDICIFRYFLL